MLTSASDPTRRLKSTPPVRSVRLDVGLPAGTSLHKLEAESRCPVCRGARGTGIGPVAGCTDTLGRMTHHTRILAGILLFAPLLFAFSYGHSYLSLQLSGLADLFQFRPFRLAALLATAVLSPLIAALLFAYPFAALYRRAAVWTSLLASVSAATWQYVLMGDISSKSFVIATWVVDFACLVALLPVVVWMVRRQRLHDSGVPKEPLLADSGRRGRSAARR